MSKREMPVERDENGLVCSVENLLVNAKDRGDKSPDRPTYPTQIDLDSKVLT